MVICKKIFDKLKLVEDISFNLSHKNSNVGCKYLKLISNS